MGSLRAIIQKPKLLSTFLPVKLLERFTHGLHTYLGIERSGAGSSTPPDPPLLRGGKGAPPSFSPLRKGAAPHFPPLSKGGSGGVLLLQAPTAVGHGGYSRAPPLPKPHPGT